jgi:serine/threonine protein kinase
LKPDNILLADNGKYQLIDFGSAVRFEKAVSFSTNTPEYAPPEAMIQAQVPLSEISQPWSFDIWSLGMIFLEIAVGFPLWLSLKSRINGEGNFKIGLLAVGGREKEKIF